MFCVLLYCKVYKIWLFPCLMSWFRKNSKGTLSFPICGWVVTGIYVCSMRMERCSHQVSWRHSPLWNQEPLCSTGRPWPCPRFGFCYIRGRRHLAEVSISDTDMYVGSSIMKVYKMGQISAQGFRFRINSQTWYCLLQFGLSFLPMGL